MSSQLRIPWQPSARRLARIGTKPSNLSSSSGQHLLFPLRQSSSATTTAPAKARHYAYKSPIPRAKATHFTHKRATHWGDRFHYYLGLPAVAVGLIVATNLERVPVTGRLRLMLLEPEEEEEIAKAVIADINRMTVLSPEEPAVQLVQRVSDRLTAEAARMGIEYDWEVFVVNEDVINATCAPTGKIVFYGGLLVAINEWVEAGLLPDMEGGIAAVMAHEIAHAVARHVAERHSVNPAVVLATKLLTYESPLLTSLFQWAQTYGLDLPMSRGHELEADQIGMVLMGRACYDPRLAPILHRLLDNSSGLSMYLSTHPTGQVRYDACQAYMPAALRELCTACDAPCCKLAAAGGDGSDGGGPGGGDELASSYRRLSLTAVAAREAMVAAQEAAAPSPAAGGAVAGSPGEAASAVGKVPMGAAATAVVAARRP